MHVGSSLMGYLQKAVRESENENIQDATQRASNAIDQQITETRSQADKMRKQAKIIGKKAILDLVTGIFSSIISAGLSFIGGAGAAAGQLAGKLIDTIMGFLRSKLDKENQELAADIRESEAESQSQQKAYNEAQKHMQESIKRKDDARQDFRQATRDLADGVGALIRA